MCGVAWYNAGPISPSTEGRSVPPGDSDTPLLPALLDRLIDTEPDVSREPMWKYSFGLGDLKEQVRRDLEYLLNARHTRPELAEGGGELAQCLLTYGLPDFTSWMDASIESRERLRRTVERAISTFEPRLTNVHVRVEPPAEESDRSLHLTIEAVLHMDPIIEQVTFDTLVEPSTGACDVKARS